MLQYINNNGNDSWDWFAYTSISFSSLMFFGVLAHFFYKHQRNLLFGLAGAFLNEIKEETIDEWCVKRHDPCPPCRVVLDPDCAVARAICCLFTRAL